MEDGIKYIFKTLLKVPIIIVVAYFIFNIFAFCFIYFKMLGASYIVMQTAVENNYLPATELATLHNYINQFNNIEMVSNAALIVGDDGTNLVVYDGVTTDPTVPEGLTTSDARRKTQYGHNVTVGVTCRFLPVWPLQHGRVDGFNPGSGDGTDYIGDPTTDMVVDIEANNITITYNVPGLKYYPDLIN